MSNLIINANSIYDRVIRIGRQTENLVSSITFNLNMWIEEYGAGECVLNVRRNGDGSAYPVLMTIADGMATWTITDTDTAKKGRGEVQLVYRAGDKVKTSPIFTISCGESLVGGEVPEPYEEWLTELNRMTAQVEAAKTSADQSAQTAQTAAQTATTKASEAEQSANTASGFAVNASASAESASTSAQAAAQSEQAASVARTAAESAAISAQAEADDAEAAKTAAQTASESAQASEQTATEKASDAAESAAQAQESADRANVDILRFLPTDSASGAVASFTDGADNVPLKSLVVGIEPVQDLHGYDSPWPAGCGKNLFDANTAVQGYYVSDSSGKVIGSASSYVSDYIEVDAGQTYRISPVLSAGNWGAWYDENKAFISGVTGYSMAKTAPDNAKYLRFTVSAKGNNLNYATTTQVEKGSEATPWTPYSNICPISGWTGMTVNANGTEIPISWESEAGTVYGGTLDVLTGVLTVTKGFIPSYNGETLPSAWISDRDVYSEGATPTTGAEVCYTLAEPITYQLTPHEVKSLLGQNNIWADTGDTSVTYRADTTAYINHKIAEAISALA